MFQDVEDFLKGLMALKEELLLEGRIEILYKRVDKVSFRIKISPFLFIDGYLNTATRRFDFSLIKNDKRVFGFDNLKNWHYHPVNDPEGHIQCDEPSLRYVFVETVKIVKFVG